MDENISIDSPVHPPVAPTVPALEMDPQSLHYLDQIRKWAFFLSVIGFLGVGFLALIGIILFFVSMFIKNDSSSVIMVMSIFYPVFAAVYFIPVYYLNRFSIHAETGIKKGDQERFTMAFMFLKSHYKFIGVLTIVMMAVYPVVMVVVMMIRFNAQ